MLDLVTATGRILKLCFYFTSKWCCNKPNGAKPSTKSIARIGSIQVVELKRLEADDQLM